MLSSIWKIGDGLWLDNHHKLQVNTDLIHDHNARVILEILEGQRGFQLRQEGHQNRVLFLAVADTTGRLLDGITTQQIQPTGHNSKENGLLVGESGRNVKLYI